MQQMHNLYSYVQTYKYVNNWYICPTFAHFLALQSHFFLIVIFM